MQGTLCPQKSITFLHTINLLFFFLIEKDYSVKFRFGCGSNITLSPLSSLLCVCVRLAQVAVVEHRDNKFDSCFLSIWLISKKLLDDGNGSTPCPLSNGARLSRQYVNGLVSTLSDFIPSNHFGKSKKSDCLICIVLFQFAHMPSVALPGNMADFAAQVSNEFFIPIYSFIPNYTQAFIITSQACNYYIYHSVFNQSKNYTQGGKKVQYETLCVRFFGTSKKRL